MSNIKIGLIGGSGFYSMEQLQETRQEEVSTPFGSPSAPLVEGTIGGVSVVMLARHGLGHSLLPADVNYRANIWALKERGVTHVLAVTACGSLQEEISPGTFVILDNFIDRTQGRAQSFYGGDGLKGVSHIQIEPAFCSRTRNIVLDTCRQLGYQVVDGGTVVTIQGPRFSSKAESNVFRGWNADVINMTTVPEVCLAKEAGLSYTSIALATDYDCWKEDNQVDTQSVLRVLSENVNRVKELIVRVVPRIQEEDWKDTLDHYRRVAKDSVIGGESIQFNS